MHTHTFMHRHFVGAPLLPIVLTLSLILSSSQVPLASVYSAPGTLSAAVSHPSGVEALLDPEAQVELETNIPELVDGGLRLAGKGIVRLKVGTAELTGIYGGFHAVKHSGNLTVSALTTPVLVRYGTQYVLVPTGRQWRGNPETLPLLSAGARVWGDARTPRTLPEAFLRDEMARVVSLSTELPQNVPAARRTLPLLSFNTDFLRFAAANERADHAWKQGVYGHLRFLVEQGDATVVRALLRNPDLASAFEPSPELHATASFFLSLTEDTAMQLTLLPLLHSSPELMTVAAAHPVLRTIFWSAPVRPESEELAVTALLGLLASDVLPEAAPAYAIERWQAEVQAYLATKKDPGAMLNFMGLEIARHIEKMEALGYPERARRYAAVLLSLTEGAEDSLTGELARARKHAHDLDDEACRSALHDQDHGDASRRHSCARRVHPVPDSHRRSHVCVRPRPRGGRGGKHHLRGAAAPVPHAARPFRLVAEGCKNSLIWESNNGGWKG
ncbi:hypothetical protein HYZ99_01855 [Candidatus Peregrinibacteria bacterium]|nr:hypothetical protein [Candidatus Peregrinibacteria bacterium]